ncbi:MAG: hypothetical protein J6T63_03295 [Bacteroidales bacterium]|nr:hypothetical protein [Bacteroidales bacterium]
MEENNEKYNIEEEGFYIIGGDSDGHRRTIPWWLWIIIGTVLLTIIIFFTIKFSVTHAITDAENTPTQEPVVSNNDNWYNNIDASLPSCIVVNDTIIDNVNMKILTPYNITPELHLGEIDTTDTDILFAALAADIRRDNGKIVGAFVLDGEPLSWGLSKRGYCAIFDDEITFGVADNSPLFEQATENGGYFFRQYPSVDNGKMVANNPENKSFRRVLCSLNGKVCVIVSTDRVLMNDFSSILVKLGVNNAIFLVGSTEDGWFRTNDGNISRLGKKYDKNNPNINYLVFRAQ